MTLDENRQVRISPVFVRHGNSMPYTGRWLRSRDEHGEDPAL